MFHRLSIGAPGAGTSAVHGRRGRRRARDVHIVAVNNTTTTMPSLTGVSRRDSFPREIGDIGFPARFPRPRAGVSASLRELGVYGVDGDARHPLREVSLARSRE